MPIFLGQKNGYREVHIETGKLGDTIFELDDVYDEKTNENGSQDPQIRAESITYLI